MAITISPATLAAKVSKDTKDSVSPEEPKKSQEVAKSESMPKEEVYQFPISPCTYRFKHSRKRVTMGDGTYRTSNAKDIEELDAKAARRLLTKITGGKPAVGKFSEPVAPKIPTEEV